MICILGIGQGVQPGHMPVVLTWLIDQWKRVGNTLCSIGWGGMKKRHILLIMIFGIHFPPETSSYGFRPTYILLEFFFNYSLNFIRHIMLTFGSKFYFWLLVYISKVLSFFFCLFVFYVLLLQMFLMCWNMAQPLCPSVIVFTAGNWGKMKHIYIYYISYIRSHTYEYVYTNSILLVSTEFEYPTQ